MVAVKVTGWPKTEGFTDDVTDVVLLALVTVCDVLAALWLKLPSPAYWATML